MSFNSLPEYIIDLSCDYVQKLGIQIVTSAWGVVNNEDKWICPNKKCCPLGAVLLKSNFLHPKEDFIYVEKLIDQRDVYYNPYYHIMKGFQIDYDWVQSFIYGSINSNIGYYSNVNAFNLGNKYYKKFVK